MNRNEDLFEEFLMMSKTFMAQASLKKKLDFDLWWNVWNYGE